MNERETPRPRNRHNYAMWIFLGIIFYFLLTEHWAHVVPYLPWVLLLACPLLHIFMHGGHGGHDGYGGPGGHKGHGDGQGMGGG